MSEEYLIYYNEEIKRLNSIMNKVYWVLERKGIVVLIDLRMEIEGERIELDMSEEEIELVIMEYLSEVLKEE